MDEQCAQMDEPSLHDRCAQMPKNERKPIRPPCHVIGLCFCSGEGRTIYIVRNMFSRDMKTHVMRYSRERKMLEEEKTVARIHGKRAGKRATGHERSWATQRKRSNSVILHVGFLSDG